MAKIVPEYAQPAFAMVIISRLFLEIANQHWLTRFPFGRPTSSGCYALLPTQKSRCMPVWAMAS
jgi:hypothetical protein